MYSFAQRSDTRVVDEPYYAHYLHWSKAEHPGRDEILESMPVDIKAMQANLIEHSSPVLFIKNMAHHYQMENFRHLLDFTNLLYIRNPRAIIRSYSRVIDAPSSDDIGIEQVKRIYDYLIGHNKKPLVLDSDDLVSNPKKVLPILCEQLGLPFEESMLEWQAGEKTYDGVWARHWYASVHQSTGFIVQQPASEGIQLRPELEQLAIDCMPAYTALKQHAISIE